MRATVPLERDDHIVDAEVDSQRPIGSSTQFSYGQYICRQILYDLAAFCVRPRCVVQTLTAVYVLC